MELSLSVLRKSVNRACVIEFSQDFCCCLYSTYNMCYGSIAVDIEKDI